MLSILSVLCNPYIYLCFRLIQDKLAVAGVAMPQVLKGYHHSHTALTQDGSTKTVSLREYMKRHLKLHEQVQSFEKFMVEKKPDIQQNPEHLLQVAANYSTLERIQQNARLELEGRPWIEDVTAVPCIQKWHTKEKQPMHTVKI